MKFYFKNVSKAYFLLKILLTVEADNSVKYPLLELGVLLVLLLRAILQYFLCKLCNNQVLRLKIIIKINN